MSENEAQQPLTERYLILAARYFFGGHALISGLNHYLTFTPDRMPRDPEIAARFVQVLLDSHLYDVVKAIEILVGACLITGRFIAPALMMEMPVTIIICYLSLFMAPSPRTIFSGLRELFLNLFLLSTYWGYLRTLILQPNLPLRPLWRWRSGAAGGTVH